MAWSTPRTWTTGEIVTAAMLNTNVRDNGNFLAGAPCCRVYNSSGISINGGTSTALTFDSEYFDTDTMHSTSSNTSRITFTTAGKYAFGGSGTFAANATGYRQLSVVLNGTTSLDQHNLNTVTGGNPTSVSLSSCYGFNAGDYVELVAYQTSGGALTVQGLSNYSPDFWAHWVSN